MGAGRLMTLALIVLAIASFFFVVINQILTPSMGLLYSNLELAETSDITARLTTGNVNYTIGKDGRSIFVPQDQIAELRVEMAGEGLGGSVVGFEIFDQAGGIGTSSFINNINRIRALEGELSRTIKVINGVSDARVHVVLPERQLFSREEREPSASIILTTRGAGLNAGQVQAVQHLVANAVPNMDPRRISIVDQRGSLLATGQGGDDARASGANFDERRIAVENRIRNQVQDLLEKSLGIGNVRAEVSVKMSTTTVTTNKQEVDPDSQVAISTSSRETTSQDTDTSAGSQQVTVGNNLPDAQTPPAPNDRSTSSTQDTEDTSNFEISRTQTTEIRQAGEILSVHVGVAIDGIYTADANGNQVYSPRPQAEINQYNLLIASALGLPIADPNTGAVTLPNQLQIISLQFVQPEVGEPLPEEFTLLGLDTEALISLGERGLLFVLAVLVLLMVVRPLFNKFLTAIPTSGSTTAQITDQAAEVPRIPPPESHAITAELAEAAASGDPDAVRQLTDARRNEPELATAAPMGIETQIDVAQVEGRVQDSALKKVGDIVIRHPEESASIVRQWLYAD